MPQIIAVTITGTRIAVRAGVGQPGVRGSNTISPSVTSG